MGSFFSKDSDVTLVITSCGRFEHLKQTLESFILHNTYPVREIIITEDSGDKSVWDFLPESIRDRVQLIINKPKLGQIKSIDLAYSKVETDYIFHCEDDWSFYRPGFIEDSMKVMATDEKIIQVWLRSFHHDIAIHSPYHFLKERKQADDVYFYPLGSEKEDWQGFSFNPGLKRVSDYTSIKSYSSFPSEKELSRHYAQLGYYAAILENDAVLHTGFGEHVEDVREKVKKRKRKQKELAIKLLCLLVGLSAGVLLGG
ncbi:glycosyltransferase family A protein [uncultured Endozoicomonas sp.]|uniref:glycosyltransferase family 2 protein n=1 Tax=uncultured Endozoicomonas sp. TaxID=432652 RepID=UPI002626BE52|nr:glycosyltransferase family A protein [uncultured Endozoicomonas sp.]